MKKSLTSVSLSMLAISCLSGCASKSSDIPATYVSPNEYASLSCPTLENEMREITRRVGVITGQVDKEASNDSWQMGIGLVLFWPALFFLEGGDGALQSEYALLKGKYEAVSTQYRNKNCGQENS